jgi:glutathione S-transferase
MNGPAPTPSASRFAPATLVTFPPSLDCELARFILVHYGVPYEEVRHTLIFSFFATWWDARTLHFPLLFGPGYPPLDTVRKMIDHCDPLSESSRKLLPDGEDRPSAEADWVLFNATLGGATAVFAYHHLLPHREVMIRPLTDGVPWHEQMAVRAAYPLFAGLLRRLLKLSDANAEAALQQVQAVVQTVDARLANGRRYLVGDRFSLSDMAFANALGPLVLPAEYGAPLPTLAEMPPVLQSAVAEMRAHPAGEFALRIYREHRGGG